MRHEKVFRKPPANWDQMTDAEKREWALGFVEAVKRVNEEPGPQE
jgi:hypothetical protein